MSPELAQVLRTVMAEVVPRYGRGYTPDQARSHLLDRWPWLTAFGVSGREDLRKLTVRRADGVQLSGHYHALGLTVDVRGTPLEGK